MSIKDLLIVAGWLVAFFLASRGYRVTETSRLKDKAIERAQSILDMPDKLNRCDLSNEEIEQELAALLTQLELKFSQFNKYTKREILKNNLITKMRSIELRIDKPEEIKEKSAELRAYCYDIVEHIETSYDNYFLNSNKITSLLQEYKEQTFGFFITIAALYFFLKILIIFY